MYNITDSKLVTKKKKKKKIAIQYVGRAGSALADYSMFPITRNGAGYQDIGCTYVVHSRHAIKRVALAR
jgi:hypothetical protein